ncbi:MAG: hypothetical protein DMD91_24985 [Candidatus Rokuibacteriota bacterium]|nr:MAG: hypothetical protein DMD91_24985 [Candidatus Rokubacteria bacterium]
MILLGAHVALGVLTVATPAVGASEDVVRARQLLVEAAAMADRIDDDSIRAGLRRDIAGAQARAGDELAALTTASKGREWRAVAMGFAAGGNISAALAAVRQVEPEPFEWLLGITSWDEARLQVVLASAQRDDVRAASLALAEISSPMFAGMAQAAVAEAHARAGHAREAAEGFRLASLYADLSRVSLVGSAARAAVYRAIGQARGRLGDRAEAIAAFDTALAAARRIEREDRRDCILAAIGAERAIAGDFDGAERTPALVRDPHQALGARAALARSLATAGDDDRAMATAERIHDEIGRMRAFIEIATVASSRGHAALAARAFEQAIAAAERRPASGISSFSFRDEALIEVARAQALNGDRDAALRTAARMLRRVELHDAYIIDAVLKAHVLALAKAGDFEAALVAGSSARRYPPGGDEWRAIGAAAGRQGAVDAVLSRGPASPRDWSRAMFLLGLAEGLLERAALEGTVAASP